MAVAAKYHVTLVPEIDMPGHMTAALAQHPELELTDITGQRQAGKLDVTNPAARKFAEDLVDEYLALFPGPVWHTGADEYLGAFSTEADYARYPQLAAYAQARYGPNANGKDAVLDFTNEIAAHVHRAGKQLRVWSDGTGGGSAVTLDPTASVMWWEEQHSPTPLTLTRAGHQVINVGWWPLYYVTGGPLTDLRTPERSDVRGLAPLRLQRPVHQPLGHAAGATAHPARPGRPAPDRSDARDLERRPE